MKEDVSLGIKYMLFASLMFAFMGASAKELSDSVSSVEVVFFRNLFGVAIILFSVYRKPLVQEGGKPLLLIFRGMAGFIALLMFFYNIAEISLAEAMTFSKTSTIFTAVFAYIFVKEKLGFKGWVGVFIGFIGILFITKFDGSTLEKTDWLGILSGVGAALAYTSIRELRKYYDSRAIVLSFMGIGTIGPLLLMLVAEFYSPSTLDFMLETFVMPSGKDWFFIILLGVFATYAQIYMTKAYSCAKAGIIGTISYANIAFSIILGMFLGDAFPDIWIILGILLIVISGFLVSLKKD
ncbi:DMT family transporter [Malaciobacter marinus]|uniref:EamA family transporter n=1 Tax=Malaciobacter marinus TaxID=505249 RepID=A0A347THA1_9BACT|nr:MULTISPECIES: DMT family transporter [Malaciobacter]AXX85979.1 EamA/RhaT family transporter, type 1 [Malaciobacter marinus]PHO11640.1 EamA family transporter [Malaciobacter marinus]PHO15921.1 EamA family transporter [Malaciobacter marinus]RYA22695.1 EamA/RhaT family transporter [Malaciobacter halophilus]